MRKEKEKGKAGEHDERKPPIPFPRLRETKRRRR